jgi:hypothetical protein
MPILLPLIITMRLPLVVKAMHVIPGIASSFSDVVGTQQGAGPCSMSSLRRSRKSPEKRGCHNNKDALLTIHTRDGVFITSWPEMLNCWQPSAVGLHRSRSIDGQDLHVTALSSIHCGCLGPLEGGPHGLASGLEAPNKLQSTATRPSPAFFQSCLEVWPGQEPGPPEICAFIGDLAPELPGPWTLLFLPFYPPLAASSCGRDSIWLALQSNVRRRSLDAADAACPNRSLLLDR